MKYYADTSFIASLLLAPDVHHSLAVATLDQLPPLPGLPLTPFGLLKLRNVFARLEWKKILCRAESEAFMRDVRTDIDAGFFTAAPLHAYAWIETSFETVCEITPRTGTRTLDALHLALAKLYGARVFLSFDANQRRSTLAAGFTLLPETLPDEVKPPRS